MDGVLQKAAPWRFTGGLEEEIVLVDEEIVKKLPEKRAEEIGKVIGMPTPPAASTGGRSKKRRTGKPDWKKALIEEIP